MVNWKFIFYFSVASYGAMVIYLMYQLKSALCRIGLPYTVMVAIFTLLAMAFPVYWIARIPFGAPLWLGTVGNYMMPIVLYGTLTVIFLKILWFFVGRFFLLSDAVTARLGLVSVVAIVAIIVGTGMFLARSTVVRHLEIPRSPGAAPVRIVAVSDIHAGANGTVGDVHRLARMIKEQSPDIVLLVGDIIDTDENAASEAGIHDALMEIKAPRGVYGVMGNHEVIHGINESESFLKKSGIEVLRNRAVNPVAGVTILGREDVRFSRGADDSEFLSGDILAQRQDVLVVADHTPTGRRVKDAREMGASLMISGHTHNGQLLPFNFVTSRIFPLSRGTQKFGDMWLLVSSGHGTWGPKMRTSSRSEIWVIDIK